MFIVGGFAVLNSVSYFIRLRIEIIGIRPNNNGRRNIEVLKKAQFHPIIIMYYNHRTQEMVRHTTEDRITDFRILWHLDIEGPKEKKLIEFLWFHCYIVMEVVCVWF